MSFTLQVHFNLSFQEEILGQNPAKTSSPGKLNPSLVGSLSSVHVPHCSAVPSPHHGARGTRRPSLHGLSQRGALKLGDLARRRRPRQRPLVPGGGAAWFGGRSAASSARTPRDPAKKNRLQRANERSGEVTLAGEVRTLSALLPEASLISCLGRHRGREKKGVPLARNHLRNQRIKSRGTRSCSRGTGT